MNTIQNNTPAFQRTIVSDESNFPPQPKSVLVSLQWQHWFDDTTLPWYRDEMKRKAMISYRWLPGQSEKNTYYYVASAMERLPKFLVKFLALLTRADVSIGPIRVALTIRTHKFKQKRCWQILCGQWKLKVPFLMKQHSWIISTFCRKVTSIWSINQSHNWCRTDSREQ